MRRLRPLLPRQAGDEDTGRIHFTDVACTLFDSGSCRCRDYARRRLGWPIA